MKTIDTETLKRISKIAMITGVSLFGLGFAGDIACNMLEIKEEKHASHIQKIKAQNEHFINANALREKKLEEEANYHKTLEKQIANMSSKEFAKWKAEADAVASDEAIEKASALLKEANKIKEEALEAAETLKRETNLEMQKVKADCSAQLIEMQTECNKKITEANDKYMDANSKYEKIRDEFKDRDKILAYKAKLESVVKEKRNSENRENEIISMLQTLIDG